MFNLLNKRAKNQLKKGSASKKEFAIHYLRNPLPFFDVEYERIWKSTE
jgi:hypothetical protein